MQIWRLYRRLNEQVRRLKRVAVKMEEQKVYTLEVSDQCYGMSMLRTGNGLGQFNQRCREYLREQADR